MHSGLSVHAKDSVWHQGTARLELGSQEEESGSGEFWL